MSNALQESSECEVSQLYTRALALIKQAQTIVISGHTNPDGDALGSGLALQICLRALFPDKDVIHVLANDHDIDRHYRFLPHVRESVHASEYKGSIDLFISVDTPNPSRLANSESLLSAAHHTLAFDHHPDMTSFAEVSIKRENEAAVGCVVWDFAQFLGYTPSSDFATCILCALMTDTGRFQYQNSNAHAFYVAGDMVSYGADPSVVSGAVYQSNSVNFLRLQGVVSDRLKTFESGRIAISYVTNEDFKMTGAQRDECDGLIDIVRSVENSEICLFLREEPFGGKVRGNLRSKTSADIGQVARMLGGGGHRAAAGFTAEGSVDDVLEQVLPLLREALHA